MTSGRKSRNRLIYTNYCGESGNRTYIPSMKYILPSFGLGKGEYFAVRYFLASAPKKVAKNVWSYW